MTGFVHCWSSIPCNCPDNINNDKVAFFSKYSNGHLIKQCYPAKEGILIAKGESFIEAPDGGYLITGFAQDYDYNTNFMLIRVDENGTELWTKIFPDKHGTIIDIADDFNQINDGYVAAGDLDGDLFIMKIDLNGNEIWTERYNYLNSPGFRSNQSGKSIISTSDGGYLVVGNSFNDDGSSSTIYVVKTDARGKVR